VNLAQESPTARFDPGSLAYGVSVSKNQAREQRRECSQSCGQGRAIIVRETTTNHHAKSFAPARQNRRSVGEESPPYSIKGEKQISPRNAGVHDGILVFPTEHLGKKENEHYEAKRTLAPQRTAASRLQYKGIREYGDHKDAVDENAAVPSAARDVAEYPWTK